MKTFLQNKKISILFLCLISFFSLQDTFAVNNASNAGIEYIEFRDIDKGTYNEYRYRMTEKYFQLREGFQVNRAMDKSLLLELSTLAKTGYKYLPDNLANKNLYSQLETNIKQSLNNERSDSTFNKMVAALQNYIEDVDIFRMNGNIEMSPQEGNAPLNTTFRANIKDPTGVEIPSYNYVWWIDTGEGKKVLGRNSYLNYTFTEEGNYAVFLGVTSNHKNNAGNSDVLPFFGKADIRVKEKVASLIMKVNSANLGNSDELKFDADEAKFGLLFDATSSTPNSGMKFIETSWDFGNGTKKKYEGAPKVEKVPYLSNGRYTVLLTLKTNSGKMVERSFTLYISHPAASIQSSRNEGYVGDKFTFSSKNRSRDNDMVNYAWEIIDINNDEVIHTKNSNVFNYIFTKKGRYNVKLRITLPNGEEDTDTKIIYINSRPPSANFITKIPFPNRPNYVFLDGSKSFDPDISDEGKLTYQWTIDGERVSLLSANENGSVGYYIFDSIGQHSIGLEVIDPDNMPDIKSGNIEINSLLDVDFESSPTAIQRDGTINFIGQSSRARFFEWDFGDGSKDYGSSRNISHTYEKSGSFVVTLTVTDERNNRNTVKKNVFVGKSNSPVSIFTLSTQTSETLEFDASACGGRGAFIANKIDSVKFDATKSIDLDGQKNGLSYSWKIGHNKYDTSNTVTYRFDELGCFPVKLTVVSPQNKVSDSIEKYVEVRNILPQLSSLTINSSNEEVDPIIFDIKAIGAKDPDGVIQSYLWYYYTDYDNEAQGFKTTPNPQTSFVLPKITGTYFFGVVLKDNNEETFSSEDLGKFFRTVSSDQSDTPIIDLKVNDNSVSINEEVVFSAKVKNIINKDLSNSVDYYWDFDGDGFFEKKGRTPTVSYKYKKSGTFYPKLKVKYRGLSNVRNLTVDVSNKLDANFDYISIGNKFIFLDKSQGKIDSMTWDFGDGNTSDAVGDVVHEYSGSQRVHTVTLTIREGTKEETSEKEVIANMKNILKARKTGVNLFSSPIIDNDIMKLTDEDEKVTIYPGESSSKNDEKVVFYAIDYDIEKDSDLNGGKDDDRDNINTSSYRNGTPISISLNSNKIQKVRVFTLDAQENLINSYDFSIEKSYIVEEEIDLENIIFEGVSEREKEKIDKLKSLLSDLPTNSRLPAMKFVQKLQEDWFDARSKTDTMVEMQMFLSQIPEYDPTEVNELLESFLVNDTADKGEREVAFNALQNLIPEKLSCEDVGEFNTCREGLIAKLQEIKNSSNIEENKKIGSEILDAIGKQSNDLMTDDSKLRFKEVLKTYVYGGVSNIPDDEIVEILPVDNDKTKKGLGILKWILYVTAAILGLIIFGLLAFFIFYKFKNKDENVEFQDFIIEKTSGKGKTEQAKDLDVLGDTSDDNDALANIDFSDTTPKKTDKKEQSHIKVSSSSSVKKENFSNIDDPLQGVNTSLKTENYQGNQTSKKEEIPNWLGNTKKTKGANLETKKDTGEKKEIQNSSDNSSGNFQKTSSTPLEKDSEIDIKKADEDIGKTSSDTLKKKDESAVPDWLKGANLETKKDSGEKKEVQNSSDNSSGNFQKTFSSPLEKDSKTDLKKADEDIGKTSSDISKKKDESAVPDWLKGSLDSKKSSDTKKIDTEEVKISGKEKVSDEEGKVQEGKKAKVEEKTEKKPQEKIQVTPSQKETKQDNSEKQNFEGKLATQEKNIPKKKVISTDNTHKDLEELTKLDDGIPDWLKGTLDSEKSSSSDIQKSSKKSSQITKKQDIQSKKEKDTQNVESGEKKSSESLKASKSTEKKSVKTEQKKTEKTSKMSSSKLKADAKKTNAAETLGEGALWEDGMEIPDWLKGGDDAK